MSPNRPCSRTRRRTLRILIRLALAAAALAIVWVSLRALARFAEGTGELLAVDGAGAGVGEKVLIVLEGRSASEAIGKKAAPVDAAIVGIVDTVTLNK